MSPEPQLGAAFPAATRERWLELVGGVLRGAPFESLVTTTADGLEVQPLYTSDDVPVAHDESGMPGFSPYTRGAVARRPDGAMWEVRALIDDADPAAANRSALDALENGATGLLLRVDPGSRHSQQRGRAGSGATGIRIRTADDLGRTLAGVHLDLAPVSLDAGATTPAASKWLEGLWADTGVDRGAVSGCLGIDPLGVLGENGRLEGVDAGGAGLVDVLERTVGSAPGIRAVRVGAVVHAEAGASAVQQLAAMLATTTQYLRWADAGGIEPSAAAGAIELSLALDSDLFSSVAILRAARRTFDAVLDGCGVPAERRSIRIEARALTAMLTRRAPWVNLLRVSSATLAAVIGGADSIVAPAFDAALNERGALGRRLARNTQLILGEESNVGRVLDPAGGSYYVEAHTDDLARAAWAAFQEVERAGGMAAVMADGSWSESVAAAWEVRRQRIATRRDPLTGVSEFADLDEVPPNSSPDFSGAASPPGRGEPDVDQAGRLVPVRFAADFEALRDAADVAASGEAGRPAVFLANLGPVEVHTARAAFAKNLYESGGLATVGNDGFSDDADLAAEFRRSGCRVACLCSSDSVYAERVGGAARALVAAGAERVELAGRPGDRRDQDEAAGIAGYIHVGVDVVAHLRRLHELLGVTR